MAVQWFPGHMHLTRQAIGLRLRAVDVVVEMLDARLPGSSANPMLAQMTHGKSVLKVLNKQDLADPQRTAQWLAYYNAQPNTRALALDASQKAPAAALIAACQQLAPHRGRLSSPLRVLICGIPNVGKSTLINTMVGKRAAKAADEAGVTRSEGRYVLQDGFYLFDTPGVLWPRIIVAQSGFNLAASGAVGRNAFDDEEVSWHLLAYLREEYPTLLQARYGVAQGQAPEVLAQWPEETLLEAVGARRGALLSGGRVDMNKAAELLLVDFRSGALGAITLETPEQFAQWLMLGQELDAQRLARKKELQEKGWIRGKPPKKTPTSQKTPPPQKPGQSRKSDTSKMATSPRKSGTPKKASSGRTR